MEVVVRGPQGLFREYVDPGNAWSFVANILAPRQRDPELIPVSDELNAVDRAMSVWVRSPNHEAYSDNMRFNAYNPPSMQEVYRKTIPQLRLTCSTLGIATMSTWRKNDYVEAVYNKLKID